MNINKDYLYIHEVKRSAVSQALYSFFHRKILTPFLALVLAALCIAGTAGVFLLAGAQPKATPSDLYSTATLNAITMEPDEIFPLVCVVPEEEQTQWQDDKVYRIGGDELVAILRHDTDFDSGALEMRPLSVVEKENQKALNYTMSIAYGFATYSQSCDRTLFYTQARADERMYARKKIQKAGEYSGGNGV